MISAFQPGFFQRTVNHLEKVYFLLGLPHYIIVSSRKKKNMASVTEFIVFFPIKPPIYINDNIYIYTGFSPFEKSWANPPNHNRI